jgi:hypothetical protein
MNEEYKGFIEELKAAVTEIEFGARDYLIHGYHEIGKFLVESSHRYESLKQVSLDSGVPQRTLERTAQFYTKYPDLSLLPFGKSISWHKIVNQLLPEHKEQKEPEHLITCPTCLGIGKIREPNQQ